jgi:uncharacterized protein YndB with AHSA1/START domain
MTSGTLQVTTPSDREIVMTRVFDAPRHLVFEAMTRPELVQRWLGVHDGWTFEVCDIDLTVGGAYHYVWRNPAGKRFGTGGKHLEVTPNRIVTTEQFDEPLYPGEAVNTLELFEQQGKTTLTLTMRFPSREIRDAALGSGMKKGVEMAYDTLAGLMASGAIG